jgi:hypothetical protein
LIVLAHECWEDPEAGQIDFGVVSRRGDALRAQTNPNARLTYVIEAACWQDAMQEHYDRQGWGLYSAIPGVTDEPYTHEQLAEQQAARG